MHGDFVHALLATREFYGYNYYEIVYMLCVFNNQQLLVAVIFLQVSPPCI